MAKKTQESPLRKMHLEHARLSGMVSRACDILSLGGNDLDEKMELFRNWLNEKGEQIRSQIVSA